MKMNLGTFSISLAVKNLAASRAFYVREIQQSLKAKGLALTSEADESATGPASLTLIDPDGNPILVDQHVDSPQNLKNKMARKE